MDRTSASRQRGIAARCRRLAALTCLSAALPVAAGARPAPPYAKPDPVFAGIARELRSRTRLPVVLPRRLPDLGQGRATIYAVVSEATPERYEIVLGLTPGCGGGAACRLGTIGARSVATPAASQEGEPTPFDGRTGWFVPATCGANCSDATLAWRDGTTERIVGVKGADREAVVALAGAVANGAPVR